MKLNEGLAEFVGAFIGDGCMSRYYVQKEKRWRTAVLLTGHWNKDSSYYIEEIKPVLEMNLGVSVRVYHRKDDDTVRCFVNGRKTIDFLRNLGFSFGEKSSKVTIPETIFSNPSLNLSCLRGIFNTDGSVYRRYSKQYKNHHRFYSQYKVIQFSSKSKKLLEQIKKVLISFNINSNAITPNRDSYSLRINSQQEIDKFVHLIKFNHKYHISRLEKINGSSGI